MNVVCYARCPGFLVATESLMGALVQCEDADCVAVLALAM